MENTGLGGVTVRLSGMADQQFVTESDGQFTFTGLRSGTYSVEISGFDMDEVGFGSVAKGATVGVGQSKILSFDGTYLRTAGIMGQVSVDGVGLGGVTVTMTGEGEDETDVTDAGGLYGFPKLKAGTYSIAISGYDPDEVEFQTTSKTVTIALGETANEPFIGTLLRTSGISGRVSVEGMGIPDVTVTLAGAAEATYTTKDDGQYAFAGLAEGTYVVSMANPDADAYNFEETSHTVVLGDAVSEIRNFDGTHTRTASVSGVLFIDEVMQDKMLTTGEPSVTAALAPLVQHGLLPPEMLAGLLANAKVNLRGPDLNTMTEVAINANGTYTTGKSLQAGSYQVELPANNEMVAAALAAAGVAFVGESAVVTVDAGGSETVNFPFRITMQTIGVGAVMGNAEMASDPPLPVGDVTLALFPTAQDAEAGTNELGKLPIPTKTDPMTGMAAFQFARADDTSPGSEDTDNIVFVKVVDAGHDDLMVSNRNIIEVQYLGTARVHGAPTSVRLLNVAVKTQFWVKSDKDARGGDMRVGGWHTVVTMGDSEDALMMEDEDGEMVNLTMPTDDGMEDDDDRGKATITYRVTPDQLPATFTVAVRPDNTDDTDDIEDWQQPMAMGETWNQVGDNLTYTHTGFELPALNTHAMNDIVHDQGPAYVTFTTQKLTVGVYREADDVAGFSDFQSRVSHGDHRPAADVAKELSVSVMVEASGRRGLEVYDEWDHDDDPDTDAIDATITGLTGGMATFGNLPAGMDFTVQVNEGSDRVAVGGPDSRSDRVQAYGSDVELGMSTGAFGAMSGAGPEVEVCPLTTDTRPSSLGDDDSDCATFAYQWTTGSITGDVGRPVEDLDVNIDADTDTHSEAPRDTETDEDGEFGWSGVQDGVYSIAVASSDDYDVTPTSERVDVYHDEFEDDDDEDDFIGTPDTDHADFMATRLRLSIKGYAANVSHETNKVVRGDETYEGAVLELFAYDEDSEDDIMSTGGVVATDEVDADGLYEFDDLDEGFYVIVAKQTGDYEMLREPAVTYWNGVEAQLALDPADYDEEDLALPSWDYTNSELVNPTSTVTVGTGAAAQSFTFYNFALLHGNGEFSGRVREARGDPAGIAVELRRCEETTLDADDDDVVASCAEELTFPAQTNEAGTSGSWDFPDLREGYYVTNIAATTYNRAKYDSRGMIDDDAPNCMGTATPVAADCDTDRTTELYGLLQGDDAFNRGGATFYVYNRTLSADDMLTKLEVIGDPHADSVGADITHGNGSASNEVIAIPTSRGAAMTALTQTQDPRLVIFEGGVVEVKPTVSTGATNTVNSYTVPTTKTSHSDGKVTLDFEPTTNLGAAGEGITTTIEVEVKAVNGYDDHSYTFNVKRMAPQDNNLEGIEVNTNRSGSGSGIPVQNSDGADGQWGAGFDEYRATVPSGTSTVYLFAHAKPLQPSLAATLDGDELADLGGQHNNDGANESVFEVEVPATGVVNKTVEITVTSEDDVDKVYYITLNRGVTATPTATLTNLTLSGVTLGFASATTRYTASVANAVDKTTVAATAATGATAVITPPDADANTAGHQVNLAVGETVISIDVTGAGMTPRTYTVTVTRASAGANSPATGQPTISGTAKVGETLTADASGVTDADGMTNATLAYQWSSNDGSADSDISGATSETYDPVADDVGNTLKVTVRFTDDAGQDEMVTSAATAAVAAADDVPTGQQVTLVLDRSRIPEFGGVSTVTARVSPASPTAFTVMVSAAAVSPAVDGDFTLSSGNTTLSFAANATRSTSTDPMTITAVPNIADAPNKTVNVSGSVVETDATAESPAEVTLTITDDDDVPGLPRAFNVAAGDIASGADVAEADEYRERGDQWIPIPPPIGRPNLP